MSSRSGCPPVGSRDKHAGPTVPSDNFINTGFQAGVTRTLTISKLFRQLNDILALLFARSGDYPHV